MAPAAVMLTTYHDESEEYGVPLVELASAELETLRKSRTCNTTTLAQRYSQFPPACLAMLRSIDGNHRCIDCGAHGPQWATVSYGALLCLQCSGHHRSLGVQVSCVRSITMDEWTLPEVLSMLEGGNGQLSTFFSRHALSEDTCCVGTSSANKNDVVSITKQNVTRLRYKTKAAQFYRQQMELHVCNVLQSGPYRGREMSRRRRRPTIDRRNSDL